MRTRAIILIFSLGLVTTAAEASTLDLFGYGGRSPGAAGTGVATSADFESLYLNPAGLGRIEKTRLSFGALYGDLKLEIDGREIDSDPPLGTVMGAVARLRLGGALANRVSLGFGAFVPTAAIARASAPITGEPLFAVLAHRSQVASVQVGLGIKISERLCVGLTVLGLAGLAGDIFISSDAAGRFTAQSEQAMIARFAPILGAQYRLRDDLDIGLVFRAESDATFDVVVDNDLERELPLTLPTLNIGGTAQYDPLNLVVEGAWRALPELSAAVQLGYYRWSEYEVPTLDPVSGKPPAPAEFRDTFVPRASLEWHTEARGLALDIRGGYSFVMSPAPEMKGLQSLLDNHRHVAALGTSVAWPDSLPLRFDLWLQAHFLVSREHTKDPSLFTAPLEPSFLSIDTGGRILAGGLTIGVDL